MSDTPQVVVRPNRLQVLAILGYTLLLTLGVLALLLVSVFYKPLFESNWALLPLTLGIWLVAALRLYPVLCTYTLSARGVERRQLFSKKRTAWQDFADVYRVLYKPSRGRDRGTIQEAIFFVLQKNMDRVAPTGGCPAANKRFFCLLLDSEQYPVRAKFGPRMALSDLLALQQALELNIGEVKTKELRYLDPAPETDYEPDEDDWDEDYEEGCGEDYEVDSEQGYDAADCAAQAQIAAAKNDLRDARDCAVQDAQAGDAAVPDCAQKNADAQ